LGSTGKEESGFSSGACSETGHNRESAAKIPMDSNDTNTIMALKGIRGNLYNDIVKPDVVFQGTQYFRRKWVPLLGPVLSWIVVNLRQRCYWNRKTGEKREYCTVTQGELASEIGVSARTVRRLLERDEDGRFKQKYLNLFIREVKQCYRHDQRLGKRVRTPTRYWVRLDEPLIPEDEVQLRERLGRHLAGVGVDVETGQIDVLAALDRLIEAGETTRPGSPAGDVVADAAALLAQILSGGFPEDEVDTSDIPGLYPGAVRVPAAEVSGFALAEDQVLLALEDDGEFLAVPMDELVKVDFRACQGMLSAYEPTECYFSIAHALGEGGDDEWLPEEEQRLDRIRELERDVHAIYQRLGAVNLREALCGYFSDERLVDRFLEVHEPSELERIEQWVHYVWQAKGIENPPGLLRWGIENGQPAPKVVRRKQ
jgi:DNA-binding XRE family transcriptional regulator